MDEKKKDTVPDGNRHGADRKNADEGSALSVYHDRMKKTRRTMPSPRVKVIHQSHGRVIVEGGSKLIAIKNAAKAWGTTYAEIARGCEVWRITDEEERT